jgi:hypothetical protein
MSTSQLDWMERIDSRTRVRFTPELPTLPLPLPQPLPQEWAGLGVHLHYDPQRLGIDFNLPEAEDTPMEVPFPPHPAPIHRLPDDVLFLIFIKGCHMSRATDYAGKLEEEDRGGKGLPLREEFCSLARQVCRRWLNIIDYPSNPQFWIVHLSLSLSLGLRENEKCDFIAQSIQFRELVAASRGSCLSLKFEVLGRNETKTAWTAVLPPHEQQKVEHFVETMEQVLPFHQEQIVRLDLTFHFRPMLDHLFRIMAKLNPARMQLSDFLIRYPRTFNPSAKPFEPDTTLIRKPSINLAPLQQLSCLSHLFLYKFDQDIFDVGFLPPTLSNLTVSFASQTGEEIIKPLAPLFAALSSCRMLTDLYLDLLRLGFGLDSGVLSTDTEVSRNSRKAFTQVTFPILYRMKLRGAPTFLYTMLSTLYSPKLELLEILVVSGMHSKNHDPPNLTPPIPPVRFECLSTFEQLCASSRDLWILEWIHARMRFPNQETLRIDFTQPLYGPTIESRLPPCLPQIRFKNLILVNMEERMIIQLLDNLNITRLETAEITCAKEEGGLKSHQSESHRPAPKFRELTLRVYLSCGILQVADHLLEPWSKKRLCIEKHIDDSGAKPGIMTGWEAIMDSGGEQSTLTVELMDLPTSLEPPQTVRLRNAKVALKFLSLFEKVEDLTIHLPLTEPLATEVWYKALMAEPEPDEKEIMPRLKTLTFEFLPPPKFKDSRSYIEACRGVLPFLEEKRRTSGLPIETIRATTLPTADDPLSWSTAAFSL